VRLLRADLIALRRPLTWAVMAAAAVFCVLLAVGGAHNAAADAQGVDRTLPSCAAQGITLAQDCARTMAGERARLAFILAEPRQVAEQVGPIAAGAEAAGLMASLPGALVIALLAGGHAGGEWSGRTIKNLLLQHGRRWQVLTAKLVSLWIAGVAVMLACWAALALAGPVITKLDHLPSSRLTITSALAQAGGQAGRALLVIAAFAAIGLLAAVLTRGSVGTMAATAGAIIVMLLLTAIPGIAGWAPAIWVQGWMRFPAGLASVTSLPANFWSRFISASGAAPGQVAGLAGVTGLLLACLAIAIAVFRRADVSG
jgi:ABC-type transport system involved in multi-copper enzyme maturation permease subunit